MKPIIKWPGGKSREIDKIESLIPDYKRYVEPFFGGGALFFHLEPKSAAINDISESLIQYYKLIKEQDKQLYDLLICYNNSFNNIVPVCSNETNELLNIFYKLKEEYKSKEKEIEKILQETYINMLSEVETPKESIRLDEIPRTGARKIDKEQIRKQYLESQKETKQLKRVM